VARRRDLLAAGISAAAIARGVQSGWLHPQHRGVYRVGHRAPDIRSDYLAAVYAGAGGDALYGLAAAHLMGLVRGPAPPPSVLTTSARRVAGVCRRRVGGVDSREVWVFDRIRCTTPARTLVDLAASLPEDDLARACHEAGVKYRTKPRHVELVLGRRPNAKGAAKLRRIMSGDTRVTLSKLERGILALLRKHGRVLPVMNKPAGAHRVDCRWPELKLTVELDSYTFHNSRYSWEQDRKREREARARGDDFRRYGPSDVLDDPRALLAELLPLLPVDAAHRSSR
ncbi:MAG: type IV toxin-antitoxin system AbiEi family antitoxin domain-containing protein, partial [Thermoleophilaceae bacterium]|nr:type IV toxin-antitoxin system AbiEi family antitoxin domain-containing protein [Thermoleophilaceae bacterium]